MLCKTAQNLHHRTGSFAGADHVGEKRRERLRMGGAGVGKILAADDAVAEIAADVTLGAIVFALVRKRAQRLSEGEPGFYQIGELGS